MDYKRAEQVNNIKIIKMDNDKTTNLYSEE